MPAKLWSDSRGAMMVAGIFLACFLAAGLWYIVGVSSAIVYRERVQDAADGVAFASAVYHARGMNILGSLNIIMAAMLGLVVAVRLLKFLNQTAMFIGCGCAPVPFIGPACAGVCSTTKGIQNPISQAEIRVTQLYNKVGPILSTTQKGVAIAMPWVAEAKAIAVSQKYKPDVVFGATVSASMVPLGDRLGLPVQEGDDAVLCGKVSSGIVDLTFDTLHLPGMVKGWVGGTLEGFVASFCGGGDLIDPKKQEEIVKKEEDKQVDKRCDFEGKVSKALNDPLGMFAVPAIEQARQDHIDGKVDLTQLQCYGAHRLGMLSELSGLGATKTFTIPDPPPPCPFDRGQCEVRARADIRAKREAELKAAGVTDGAGTTIDADARKKTTPKIAYGPATNGDEYFQVWSLVLARNDRAATPAKGVELAAHHKAQAAKLGFFSRLGWAQAEFYYDHDKKWSDEVGENEAMWNLRWRARLRRVKPPTIDVLEDLSGDLVGRIRGQLHDALFGDESDDGDQDGFVDALLELGFDKIATNIESTVHDKAVEGDDKIEESVREHWQKFGGIH